MFTNTKTLKRESAIPAESEEDFPANRGIRPIPPMVGSRVKLVPKEIRARRGAGVGVGRV